MAQLTINLPEFNSPDGVTLETLEAYAAQRGSKSTEDFVNMLIADALGHRPPDASSTARFPQLQALKDSLPTIE